MNGLSDLKLVMYRCFRRCAIDIVVGRCLKDVIGANLILEGKKRNEKGSSVKRGIICYEPSREAPTASDRMDDGTMAQPVVGGRDSDWLGAAHAKGGVDRKFAGQG